MSASVSTHDRASIQEFVLDQVEAAGAEPGLVALTATLEDLGLDSLDVVELSQSVKRQLGIAVGPKDFAGAVTIADAVDVVCLRAGV